MISPYDQIMKILLSYCKYKPSDDWLIITHEELEQAVSEIVRDVDI